MTLLTLIIAYFKKHGIVIFRGVPNEGDTLTVGNMIATFKQK